MHEWQDSLDAVGTPEAFAAAVLARLAEGVPVEQTTARRRLAGESWDAKAERFEELVFRKPAATVSAASTVAAPHAEILA